MYISLRLEKSDEFCLRKQGELQGFEGRLKGELKGSFEGDLKGGPKGFKGNLKGA